MEAITFPDVEGVVVGYLNPQLAARGETARASSRVPNPRPARFVRVMRTGGSRRDLGHEDAQVTVECWDSTGPGAADLARLVRGLLWAMDITTTDITAHVPTEVGGPASLEDPDSHSPRYVLTVIVRMRAQTL